MSKQILIDGSYPQETRIVILENNRLENYDYESISNKPIKGNIYLAKITRVEPSLQAAFVEYGNNKHGFLPFAEIHPDYYQLPHADRQKLVEETIAQQNAIQAAKDAREEAEMAAHQQSQAQYQRNNVHEDISEVEDTSIIPLVDDSNDTIPQDYYRATPNNSIISESSNEEEVNINTRFEFYKRYKIQEVIKRGQIILLQAIKEERGNKGATLSSYITLAGRYCVFMPNTAGQGGDSRKIINSEERRKLKILLNDFQVPIESSIIIRTAGSNRDQSEIRRDYEYLARLWNEVRASTISATAPAFIHAESDLLRRTIRDTYDNSFNEIIVEGKEAYKNVKEFMRLMIPTQVDRIKEYKSKAPIFSKFNVEEQLAALYNPQADLASGGYLIINPTEALISIDVNSGKSTQERNIEETAIKTNIEAAREVARQLRLRDLSGLVVIDFIDMLESRNRRIVEKALRDALYKDRARVQIGRISSFGLMEMSRQRLRPSFIESNTKKCPHCSGNGFVRNEESTAITLLRAVEHEACKDNVKEITAYASQAVIIYIFNYKLKALSSIKTQHNVKIFLLPDNEAEFDTFMIESSNQLTITEEEGPLSSVDNLYSSVAADMPIESDPVSNEYTENNSNDNFQKQNNPNSRNNNNRRRRNNNNRNRYNNNKRKNYNKDSNEANISAPKNDGIEGIFKGLWRKIIN